MTTVNMGSGASYTLDTRVLDKMLKDMPQKRDAIVRKAAFEIEAKAKQLAPVDTGALMSSLFTKTKNSNTFSKATSMALEKNPKAKVVPENEFGQVKEGEAIVGSSMEYAFWVEQGHHKVRARPFLGTAVEMERTAFEKMMKGLVL